MGKLTRTAKTYILTTILVGAGLLVWFGFQLEWQWAWLLPLSFLASLAQILKVEGSTHESSYNISWLVYGFTFILLGTPGAIFVIVVSHLVEWVRHRYPWYIQFFNIANFTIAMSLAGFFSLALQQIVNFSQVWQAFAIFSSLAVFTLVNHFLVGIVLKVARGQTFHESGIFHWMTLMIDYALLGTGAGAALIWTSNPFALPLSLLSLYLIYNTLKIPALQRKTEIDSKTGLYNAKYFAGALERELARANLYNRPLTLVMGDLDLLRNINNTYGHVAGDVVLVGIAKIMKDRIQEQGIVARFGGEEYAILLPEMTMEKAYTIIEEIRSSVETADFKVSTSIDPIKATISFGISQRENNKQTINDIIHNADIAMYQSKSYGRNRTNLFIQEKLSDLANEPSSAIPILTDETLKSRIEMAQNRLRPNPSLREQPVLQDVQGTIKAQPEQPNQNPKIKPIWVINTFIAFVALAALGAFTWTGFRWQSPIDLITLTVLIFLVILTEALAIEIYIKSTSISTSAIIILAGALLFGPYGAGALSLALALTAKIKHHSSINRFIFNTSNHLLYSSLIAGLVLLQKVSINEMPVYIQLLFSVGASLLAYLVNTGLVSVVIGFSQGQSISSVWNEKFRWLLPYYLAYGIVAYVVVMGYVHVGLLGVLVTLVPVYMLRFSQTQYIDHTKENVAQLHQKNSELEKQSLEIMTLNEELLHTLADIVDKRDSYTYGHSEQVSSYSVRIAQALGVSPDRVKLIQKAGLLHDIGKLGVSEKILYKPGGLSREEFAEMKRHPGLGAEIVGNIHSLQELVPIVRYHHERYDGKGYPEGLKGEEIPLEARIISLSDAVEAMGSDRPYRKGFSVAEIMAEIEKYSGAQFDPVVIDAFKRILQSEGVDFIKNSATETDHQKKSAGFILSPADLETLKQT